jgi:hypothetical protein
VTEVLGYAEALAPQSIKIHLSGQGPVHSERILWYHDAVLTSTGLILRIFDTPNVVLRSWMGRPGREKVLLSS